MVVCEADVAHICRAWYIDEEISGHLESCTKNGKETIKTKSGSIIDWRLDFSVFNISLLHIFSLFFHRPFSFFLAFRKVYFT